MRVWPHAGTRPQLQERRPSQHSPRQRAQRVGPSLQHCSH
ncbi:hypothetical protein ACHAW6_004561 [Cyclotella cf. meneghiniana]